MGLKSLRITQSVETEYLGEMLFSFLYLLRMRKDRVLCCVMVGGYCLFKALQRYQKKSLAPKNSVHALKRTII